jgi:hypothetical protein
MLVPLTKLTLRSIPLPRTGGKVLQLASLKFSLKSAYCSGSNPSIALREDPLTVA